MAKFIEEFWMQLTAALVVLLPLLVGLVRAWLRAKIRQLEVSAEQAALEAERASEGRSDLRGPQKMDLAISRIDGPLSSRPRAEQEEMIERVLPRVRRQTQPPSKWKK